jgi:cell division protein FtsL
MKHIIMILFVAFIVAVIMYINTDLKSKRDIERLQSDITQLEYQISRYEIAIDNLQETDTAQYNNFLTYLNNCE